jgi:signal transduction histidine kinase
MRVVQKPWLPGAATGLLVVLCAALGYHQYHWLNELATAEADQLHRELNERVELFSQALSEKVDSALMRVSTESAASEPLFRRLGVVDDDLKLYARVPGGTPQKIDWPPEWEPELNSLRSRLEGGPLQPGVPGLIEAPLHGPPDEGHRRLLLAEIDAAYVRTVLLPPLVSQILRPRRYDVAVLDDDKAVYESTPDAALRTRQHADASAPLFLSGFGGRQGPGPPPPERRGPQPRGRAVQEPHSPWRIQLRRREGSIDEIVWQIRFHNTLLSTGMLVLIAGIIALLGHLSSRTAQLAALQMNFVAGVSHELRTPLTVIRTAAFNLRGKLAQNPEQVERYGALIQGESDKLTGLVEQVLLFARADSAPAARERKPVRFESLIESSLNASLAASAPVESAVESGLPVPVVDEQALGQVLRNLFDNAVKYGDGMKWLGISARLAGKAIEIEIMDHGPGIPRNELPHVFEPFFRGKRAVDDQIHGTGLGLSLAKRIIEANGGTVRVSSSPAGTAFTLTLPV